MGLFDKLIRTIRRQPSVGGPWLRDHLARIAPHDGTPAPRGAELTKLLDDLDQWALEIYDDRKLAGYWGPTLKEWRKVSSPEAIAAVMELFGDRVWIEDEVRIRVDASNGERGFGLGHLHDEFVRAGLIPGPGIVQFVLKPI